MEVPGHPLLNEEWIHAFVLRLDHPVPVDEGD